MPQQLAPVQYLTTPAMLGKPAIMASADVWHNPFEGIVSSARGNMRVGFTPWGGGNKPAAMVGAGILLSVIGSAMSHNYTLGVINILYGMNYYYRYVKNEKRTASECERTAEECNWMSLFPLLALLLPNSIKEVVGYGMFSFGFLCYSKALEALADNKRNSGR